MYPLTTYFGQARLAEFHEQAERDALARAARQARRARRAQRRSGHGGSGLLAAVISAARRPAPAPEGPC
jgi:hypothetical protein